MQLTATVICIFALAAVGWGLSTHKIMQSLRECKAENNCQEDLLQELRRNEIPQTNEGLNAIYCTGKKINLITADNTVNNDILKTVLTKMYMNSGKAASVAAACQSQLTGPSNAEAAKSIMTCIQSQSK